MARGRAAARSRIGAPLLHAYLRAQYAVQADPPFVLRVGRREPALARLYGMLGARSAAYVTACNPRSRRLAGSANRRRQARLQRALERAALPFLAGIGADAAGRWPGEPSFLVFGMALGAAAALGRRFGQNAIVWCGPDAVPQLQTLR
jgi:hypothetical protein